MRSHVMPWKESSAACEQRVFIERWSMGEVSISELCPAVRNQPEDGLQADQPIQGIRLRGFGRP